MLPSVAAPDPDIFDGRVSSQASAPSSPESVESGSGDSSQADSDPGETAASRDFEAVGGIGGEAVSAAGSKQGAESQASGDTDGSGASGGSVGGTNEGAGGNGTAVGGGGGDSDGSGRNLDEFGIGAGGSVSGTPVEINRSKVGMPSSGVAVDGADEGDEDPQAGGARTPSSGKSGVDFGTTVPSGL